MAQNPLRSAFSDRRHLGTDENVYTYIKANMKYVAIFHINNDHSKESTED